MVAGLAGEVRDGVPWRKGAEAAAADEIETEEKDPSAREDEVAERSGNMFAIFKCGELNGACGLCVVKGLPGKTGGAEIFEERFVDRRIQSASFQVAAKKESEGLKCMEGGTAVESIRVEIAGDNGGTGRKMIQ
jgi:hypothetical protein